MNRDIAAWVQACATIVLVIITFIYVDYVGETTDIAKENINLTKEYVKSTKDTVNKMSEQTDAIINQTKEISEQVEILSKQFELGHAYLQLVDIYYDPAVYYETFIITFKNNGGSTAELKEIEITLGFVSEDRLTIKKDLYYLKELVLPDETKTKALLLTTDEKNIIKEWFGNQTSPAEIFSVNIHYQDVDRQKDYCSNAIIFYDLKKYKPLDAGLDVENTIRSTTYC